MKSISIDTGFFFGRTESLFFMFFLAVSNCNIRVYLCVHRCLYVATDPIYFFLSEATDYLPVPSRDAPEDSCLDAEKYHRFPLACR